MNLKDRYRAKLIEHMFQQEQESENHVKQQVQETMRKSKQQKLKNIMKNLNQKNSIQSNQKPSRSKNILNHDKQNQGDTHNKKQQNKKASNFNINQFQNQKYQISKKIVKKEPDSLLELSQIENDHNQNKKFNNFQQKTTQLLTDNHQKIKREKKKKTRFIDKIKHITQENSCSVYKNDTQQIQKKIIQNCPQKQQLVLKQFTKNGMNESLDESSLTKLIKNDKTVVPLFNEFEFNFTIDIEISSGVKIPLQVNQKSDIKQLSELFVKKHNLSNFDNLAQLLQKQIQHQIQKQKKQKICNKYKKTAQKYQKIANKNHVEQILIDLQNQQNQSGSIESQLYKNYNSSSLQQVQQAQYINLCTKQPFLIPHQLYQKAKQKKYSYKQKQQFQSIQDKRYESNCYSQDQGIVDLSKNNKDWSQTFNQNQQIGVQQVENYQKSNNISQKTDFKIEQRANFNYLNCFDNIQDIQIKKKVAKDKAKNRQLYQNSQNMSQKFYKESKFSANKQNNQIKKFQKSVNKEISPQYKRIQNNFKSNNKNISRIQDYCKINHQSKQLQSDTANLVQQDIQQNIHQQDCLSQDQEQPNSCPRINVISEQIVNRLGKNNILRQKKKKNNFIKESIMIQRQQKLKKQLQECSFKPKINLISKFIDKKVKLSQFLQSNNSNPRDFENNTLQNNYSFHFQKNKLKKIKDRFDQLYENSKVLSNKKQQIRRKSIQEISFRPEINTISKKIMQSKRNSRDLTDSVGKVKNRSESFQFHPKTLFQGKDLTYALDRNLEGLPIGEYLYKQAMKLKKKRQSLQILSTQNFKTLQTSQKLIQCAKQRKLQQIFNQLSKFSSNELLYPGDFDLNSPKFNKNSKNPIKYFVPLLKQMQQLQVQLNKDEFTKSALKLFSILSQNQKAQILNSKKCQLFQNSIQKKQRMKSSKKNSLGLLKNQKDDIYFRGLLHRKNVKDKVELELQNKVRKELTECTFKPRIKNYQTLE